MTQASPSCHFHGKPWKVQRLPETLVEIAADVLDGRDAGARAASCAPEFHSGKSLIASRPVACLVFGQQILDLRAVAVRPERGRERMIDAGGVDADELDLLLHQPFGRVLGQARRVAEIFLAVGIACDASRC